MINLQADIMMSKCSLESISTEAAEIKTVSACFVVWEKQIFMYHFAIFYLIHKTPSGPPSHHKVSETAEFYP